MPEIVRDVPAEVAAKAMGVSRAALSKWTNKRKPPAPARREGRRCFYNLVELERWRAEQGLGETGGRRMRSTASPPPPQQQGGGGAAGGGAKGAAGQDLKQQLDLADLRRKLAAAEKQELELAELRGDMLRRQDVETERATRVAYAKAVLMGGPAGLAPDLVDDVHRAPTKEHAVAVVERSLRDWRDRVLRELSGG